MLRLWRTPPALLMFLILLALFGLPAGAATFTVTNLNNSGAGSLRQAVIDANEAAGDDTIEFQSGLSGTILLSSQIDLGSSSGSLTINGPGASVLAISGNNATRIFFIGSNVTINNLTLKNGRSSSGGAIYGGGTITINQCVLSNNSAPNGSGGAIDNLGTMTITNSILSDNSAKSAGGAIFNRETLTVSNSTLAGNSATVTTANTGGGNGGGIHSGNSTVLTITNSTLSGNSATNSAGGGGGYGGGIHFTGNRLTIVNSTLSGNSASAPTCPTSSCPHGKGGGLYASGSTNDISMSVLDSTFTGNAAANQGGSIYLNSDTLTVGNSIVSGNQAPNGKEVAVAMVASLASQGHNLFGENGAAGLVNASPIASDRILAGAIGTAIGSLADDNGGPTQTHLPVPGGPVIDAGDNTLIPEGVTTDQRGMGFPRIVDGTVDIGAVEGVNCYLVLENHTVTGTERYEACQITAGPAFVVTATGDATFRSGQRITLRPGFVVQAGGRFRAEIDLGPAAAAAAAEKAAAEPLSPSSVAPTADDDDTAPGWPHARALTWSELPVGLQARLRDQDATLREVQQSADGKVMVFATEAPLVGEDNNRHSDIYYYAVDTDTLRLVSRGQTGRAADGPSHSPRLDGDGRHLLYLSTARDLVAGPSNPHAQIYHHDLWFETTTCLTRTADGHPGAGASDQPLLAGEWAIYRTAAPDLAPAGPGLYRQHLHDGQRQAVGLDDSGVPDPQASRPAADAAGDQIAYQRPDADARQHIYLNDLLRVERLSLADDPLLGALDHCCAALSADGRYLAYREQGATGPAWLHLRDRHQDRDVRLPWPADEVLQAQAPQFRQDGAELWWIAPEQATNLPEVLHRLENPLSE